MALNRVQVRSDRRGQEGHLPKLPPTPTPKTVSALGRSWKTPGVWFMGGLILCHLLLGFLPKGSFPAKLYPLFVLAGSLILVLQKREPQFGLCAAAYIAGAEIFWRMSRAGVFHEFAKYAICLVLIVAILRQSRLKVPLSPVIYFLLLIPASLVTLISFEWYTSRRLISQNLSGPFALVICAVYCRYVVVSRPQLIRILICMILPLIAAATYAARGISAANIDWGSESNFGASAGFGPNQVSAMLGLGSFTALVIIVLVRPLWLRLVFCALLLWLLGQASLTFSRTGIYLAVLSSAAAGMFLLKNRNTRLRFLAGMVAVTLIGTFVVFPALDALTGGKLAARFSETQLTNRSEIATADLKVWRDHPLLGAGIGQAAFGRMQHGFEWSAAHTEYTRLLAEHGLLGALALVVLLIMAGTSFFRQRNTGRAVAAGMLVWALLFMTVSATRLAGPSFLIGLSFGTLTLDTAIKRVRLQM